MSEKMRRCAGVVWNAVWPLLFYETVSELFASLLWQSAALTWKLLRPGSARLAGSLAVSSGVQLALGTAGSLLAAAPLWMLYLARRAAQEESAPKVPGRDGWIRIAGLGVLLCLFGNFLVLYLPVSWESYNRISGAFYTPPAVLRFLCVGIAAPLAEEILFRGVVYGWLRRTLPPAVCIPVTALAFGIYHGNMVQAVYAGILGLALAWVMERFGTLKAPCLLHISANLTSLLISDTFLSTLIGGRTQFSLLLFVLSAAASVALMMKL